MHVSKSISEYGFEHFYQLVVAKVLFTNDKGRLAPLTCHTVQTLKSAVKV